MTRVVARGPGDARTTVPRDGCVVEAAPISSELRAYIDGWNAGRWEPALRGRSAIDALSAETVRRAEETAARIRDRALREATRSRLAVGPDKIELIAAARTRYRYVELRDADMLLTSIGRAELLFTLPVVPNPHARPAARAECEATELELAPHRTAIEAIRRGCCDVRMTTTAVPASFRR